MKIGFFDDWTLGVVKNDTHIVDVSEVLQGVHAHGPQELITLIIENWDQVKDAFQNLANVSEGKPLSEVRIRPPIPRPDKIVCMAVNYLEYGQRPRNLAEQEAHARLKNGSSTNAKFGP